MSIELCAPLISGTVSDVAHLLFTGKLRCCPILVRDGRTEVWMKSFCLWLHSCSSLGDALSFTRIHHKHISWLEVGRMSAKDSFLCLSVTVALVVTWRPQFGGVRVGEPSPLGSESPHPEETHRPHTAHDVFSTCCQFVHHMAHV